MFKTFKADLHIHTCLSPCGDLEMTPSAIVREAKKRGLEIIGICDHNSAENITATQNAGQREGIAVIAGMEVTSSEEVHILALFDDFAEAIQLQTIIYEHLVPGVNDEAVFGEQVVVNYKDEVLGFNPRLLIGATSLTVQKVIEAIHSLSGLAIASHIDREAFGIIGQLGFVPADSGLDGLEVSPRISCQEARAKFPDANNFSLVTFSDAHYLQDIGKTWTQFLIKEPTVKEMKMALIGEEGRKILTCAIEKQ
ncbi:MAG: PHP domain-containing protein [Nitrospirota bacterium]